MRNSLLVLSIILTVQTATAQSIGIGTTTPNAKAALDISSTTKGLLIPSMTTSQRLQITVSPSTPNGLMVYDTDRSESYHYNGSSWSPILNDSYWIRPSAGRNRIANANDSIGIGTNSPTEWLDVDGNIRARNNLVVNNNINATGSVQGGQLITSGSILAAGTSLLNGDVTTNSDLIINNTAAILQLKSSGENKGYFQLSGNNVRMGTNSGNTTGNLIIRMNGNDRISINPSGNIDLDGKITRTSVTGNAPLLPVCMGQVREDGAIINGTGNFTVEKDGTGVYIITCSQFVSTSIILITPMTGVNQFIGQYGAANKIFVLGSDNFLFNFIVYNLN
jgi:hypothetical protein